MNERVLGKNKTSATPSQAIQASSPPLHQDSLTSELSESLGSNSNISKELGGIQPKTIRRSLNWQNITVEAPSRGNGMSLPGGIQRQQEEPGAVIGERVSADSAQKTALESSNSTISIEKPAQKPLIARAPLNGRNIPVEAPPRSAASSTYSGGIQRLETSDVKEQQESTESLQMQPQRAIQSKSSEGEPQEKEDQNKESVQTKLTVGAPGDKYEQEADSMAAKVMRMPDSAIQQPIQRQTGEETEAVQMQPLVNSITPLVQRSSGKEEEVQMKSGVQRASDGSSVASGRLESQLAGSKGGGSALPDDVRSFMEPRFGADFSNVKVHTDSNAVQMNKELGAQAFAHGSDIYYGAGKSPEKNELTAHELTHVVQQNGGTVMRSPLTTVQSVDSVAETQRVNQLQPFISGKTIQRTWDTSGDEPVYTDNEHDVKWHLCSKGELWFETNKESSPYTGYAGIENKGSYAKWFMLSVAPFELIKKQTRTIEIPKLQELDPKLHEAYQLYVYLIGTSTFKWSDMVKKPPFSNLGWKDKDNIHKHYKKNNNPLVEKEDGGLEAYYGSYYKIMNPFLRTIAEEFGEERYDQIIEGNIGSDSAQLLEILNEISKKAKFNSDTDESTLKDLLAQIRGAKKELKKNSEITPIDHKKIPTVYRGDSSGIVDVMARQCGFNKTLLDQKGELEINKNWTQFQFVSTSLAKEVVSVAESGTIWNIDLGSKCTGTSGGSYAGENEVLFPAKTTFYIKKIVTPAKYNNSGSRATNNTKYIVYATQGC